jgi:hypothetical protein
MLRASLLLALAPEPACGARDGDGAGLTPPAAGQIAGTPVKARASRPGQTPSPASR